MLNNRRHIGPIGISVNLERDRDDSLPGERRLEESHANEVRVDDRRKERVAEHDSAENDANEDKDFRVSDYFHGVVVVG